jgi:8-oxo-dGTP diphosphatase
VAGSVVRGDGDGWVWCERGHKHWGRFGAAGLLVRDRDTAGERVLLQHRALWSHEGGTWGLPGGARNSDESAVAAALREAEEEAGLIPAAIQPTGLLLDDHGGWSYTTVVAERAGVFELRPGGESIELRWVDTEEIDRLPMHPGFASTWPRLRAAPAGTVLVVDAANVIGARGRGDGWWRDRAGAARRLRDALIRLAASGIATADLAPAAAATDRSAATNPAAAAADRGAGTDPGAATEPAAAAADRGAATEPAAAAADRGAGTDPGEGFDVLLPRIVLVVEGAARSVATEPAGAGPVEVLAAEGSGDDAIVAVAEAVAAAGAAGRQRALVVTADRALAARVAAAGAATVRPSWLLRLIDAPARHSDGA